MYYLIVMASPNPMSLYEQAAQIGQACAHPKRLQVLVVLSQAERSVGELAELCGLSVAALSAHLQALKRVSLVASRREGKQIVYRLADPAVYPLVSSLMASSRALLPEAREIGRQCLEAPEVLVDATPRTLAADLEAGRVTLLDLRPETEFAAGHLPGARLFAFAGLLQRLEELPRRRRLVGYCRGPYCLSAVDAVRAAGRAGVTIKRLPFGVNEWRAAGLPLETGGLSLN